MKIHPAAELIPPMTDGEYAALKADIDTSGLLEPIVTCKKQILDGRHRFRACQELHIKPLFTEYTGDDPTGYVISLNLHRRHLSESQRSMIASALETLEHGQRRDANLQDSPVTRTEAAALLNVSERSVASAAKVRDEGIPELVAAVEQGRIAVSQAAQIASRPATEQQAIVAKVDAGEKPVAAVRAVQRDALGDRVASLPTGEYRVLYADPPWKYGDERSLDGYTTNAAANSYPTMTVDELAAITLPAAADAVLFMWATAPLLPDALALGKAWGFTYKQNIVWDKVQPGMGGLGHYTGTNHEHLLIFTRGSCLPEGEKPDSVQSIPKTKRHSEKPEEFRTLIDAMYPAGPRIELFRRGDAPPGWVVWGNEAAA